MARLFTSGFELQSVTALMEFDAVTNSPTIDTTIKRSGAASLRANVSATTAFIQHTYNESTVPETTYYFRFYLYIATGTDALDNIFTTYKAGAATQGLSLRMNSDRTLELWDDAGGAQIGSDSSALSVDTWYRIEISSVNTGGFQTTAEAKIDGTSFASGSLFLSGSPGLFRLGAITSTTADLYFDDLAINDASGSVQNSWPGPGNVVHIYPNGAGDNNGASSGDYQSIDEKPTPDDATSYLTLDANDDIVDVACESSSTAGIGSSDTVSVIQVGVRESAFSAAAESWVLRIKSASGGTTTEGSTISHNDVNWRTHRDVTPRLPSLTSYLDPTTGVAWTPTGTNSLDNMQIGIRAVDATPDILVSSLWAIVDYVSSGGGGGGTTPTGPFMTTNTKFF